VIIDLQRFVASERPYWSQFESVLDYVPDGADLKVKLNDTTRAQLLRAMPSLKERAKTLIELISGAYFIFADRPLEIEPKAAALLTPETRALIGQLRTALEAVTDWRSDTTEAAMRNFAEQNNLKLGAVAQPLRVALTGRTTSPGIFDVLAVLGRDECLARLADQAEAPSVAADRKPATDRERVDALFGAYRANGLAVVGVDDDTTVLAAQLSDALGLPHNSDYNGASQAGVGYYQRYIENGWRVSAARAFLRPITKKRNLEIRTRAQAIAVVFEGKRAIGVRYAQGPGRPARDLKARREVILTAGAANTPKLLQISGVGPPALLADLGVPILHELPGVGANLQDHYMIHFIVRVKGIKTISGRGLALLREGAKWVFGRPSVLALSPSLVYGFANSRDLSSTPDIQLDIAIGNYSNHTLESFPVLKPGFYQLRPKSTGFVRACSPDPFRAPIIQPNYLVDERDQRVVVDGGRE